MLTNELDTALDGADFVLRPDPRRRAGGTAPRRDDSARLRLHRPGDDRRGGFAKAMRTVPVVLEIATRARELAADGAWIVDFTNPVGIVTRALLDAGHRAVGLCNVAIGFQRHLARLLGVEPGRVLVDQVGLNHLTWVRAVLLDGRDVLARAARRARRRAGRGDVGVSSQLLDGPRCAARRTTSTTSTRTTGCWRSSATASRARPRWRRSSGSCSSCTAIPALIEKPALLEQRGGAFYSEAALGLVRSLVADDGGVHEVDMRNDGTLAGLADDDVVEVPGAGRPGRPGAAAAAAARAGAARPRAARRGVRASDGARRR